MTMTEREIRQKAIEVYETEWHNGNTAIIEAYTNGASYMLEQVEEWLKKSGRGQMMGSLNRFLDNKVNESK